MRRKQERFDGLEVQVKLSDTGEEQAVTDPAYDIAELAGRITKENRPAPEDVDFGNPVGKEKL